MIFLKSVLAGLLFLVGAALLLPVLLIVIVALFFRPPRGTTVGFDPVSMVKAFPIYWLVPILIFLLGFFWEYRRARSH